MSWSSTGKYGTPLPNDFSADTKHSVPNAYDEYQGYPHYFWTFPGDMLKEIQQEYTDKLIEGVRFVIS